MLWSRSDLERLENNIGFHLPSLARSGDADPLTVGLLFQAQTAVAAVLHRDAPPPAVDDPGIDESDVLPARKPRKPRAGKPAAEKRGACSVGERHRFKDGMCKCGATKGAPAPVATLGGVTKVDPPSRPLPVGGMLIHYFPGDEAHTPCGRQGSELMQAARTDDLDAVTCQACTMGAA